MNPCGSCRHPIVGPPSPACTTPGAHASSGPERGHTAFTCDHCGVIASQPTGAVNRARKKGMRLFCERACAGRAKAARRALPVPGTPEGREHKARYDAARRAALGDVLREQKREAYRKAVEERGGVVRSKQRARREANRHRHADYCRTPEYRAWKSEYDRRHRAKEYGEFAEAHIALVQLQALVDERMTRDEVYAANGTVNKKQTRRRQYEAAQRL